MRVHLLRALVLLLALAGFAFGDPQRVPIWPGKEAPNGDGSTSPASPALTVHPAENPNGAAMVICPGGGYGSLVTGGEGHGIAKWLNGHGITGLVLEYRLPQGKSKVPLLDAQRAIRLARAKAADWKIDPKRIGIIGFSAGGHLASTAATRFDDGAVQTTDPVERFSSRPDFAVLVYPVITMGEFGHGGSRNNLLGPNPTPQLIEAFSSEKQVTDRTPPVFLTHAKDDKVVVPRNSELFAEALKAHKVPYEYLELPNGGHGLNGYKGPSWDAWQAASIKWLEKQGMLRATAASRLIPATDLEVLQGFSLYNWTRTADGLHSPVTGASFRFFFPAANTVVLKVDTSRLKYSAPSRFPIVAWTVDKGPLQTHQLVAGETSITLCSSARGAIIDFYIKGLSPFEDRFNGDVPANALSITGFEVTPAGGISPQPPGLHYWLNLGDSILSGDGAAYAGGQGRPHDDQWAASDDARASYGYLLARHYNYNESRLAFGGYAWNGGLAKNPAVPELIDQVTSTTSRLKNDKLWPAPPDVVLINLGENRVPNAEIVTASLTKLRQRCKAETKVIVMIPVSGKGRAEITAAVKGYIETSKDARTHVVDLGEIKFETCDGQHPTAAGHRTIYEAALPHFDKLLK